MTHAIRLRKSFLAVALLPLLAAAAASAGPKIKLAPGKVNFGQVSGSKSRTVKIQNKGDSELVVSSVAACAGTSEEFTFAAPPGPIAPKKSSSLGVTYTPADDGQDVGCLEIESNDTASPTVELGLRGAARSGDSDDDSDGDSDDDSDGDSDGDPDPDDDPATEGLRLKPRRLDFGSVEVDSTATRTFRVRSSGGATFPTVAVNRCATTSDEYEFSPESAFVVEPGRGTEVQVDYTPADEGVDEGCLEVRTGAADEVPAVLELEGEGVAALEVDLDIHDFKVKKEARLAQGQRVHIRLWVKNPGTEDASRDATVTGEQNGEVVYEETLPVSDRPGNQGVTPYRFPPFQPEDPGDVLWTATIDDDDPDADEWLAVTRVIDSSSGGFTGVDLDIRRFRVTRRVDLDDPRPIEPRVWIESRGATDEPREATLTGTLEGDEVYSAIVSVVDSGGNRGATRFDFPPHVPDEPGDILWELLVDDDDPDDDRALAVTRVVD